MVFQKKTDRLEQTTFSYYRKPTGTCGMFDWTLFDNSNRTKVVQRPKSWDVRLGLCSTTKLTIVEHKINQTKSEK
jgi:hypothetical protein